MPSAASDEELDAVRTALTGNVFARAINVARALAGILRNPNDTAKVFVLYVTLNAPAIPRLFASILADPDGLRIFERRAAIDSRSVDFPRLRALPEGTLGCAYARHLDVNRLDPDIFQAPPGAPEAIGWLAQRLRQSHDIWHVLTGYGTDVPGEICLQAFTHAQLRVPGPAVLATAGSLRWAVRHPTLPVRAADAWRRGRNARSFLAFPWEDHWETPLETLRAKLGLVPACFPCSGPRSS